MFPVSSGFPATIVKCLTRWAYPAPYVPSLLLLIHLNTQLLSGLSFTRVFLLLHLTSRSSPASRLLLIFVELIEPVTFPNQSYFSTVSGV